MKLKEIVTEEDKLLNEIKSNRKKSYALIEKNAKLRSRLNKLRDEIFNVITSETEKGKTLHKICLETFGKIDRRFYKLYFICVNRFK